jgi:mevalonate kinase
VAVGSGHGKLILFGEHAAVYGHPAVGLQMPQRLELSVTEDESGVWRLPELAGQAAALVRRAIAALPGVLEAAEAANPPLPHARVPDGGVLRFGGDLPMSVGLGSSAAFSTALVRAFTGGAGNSDPDTLWAASHSLEAVFHGTPSGIDTGLSLHPGCSVLRPGPPGLPARRTVELPEGWLVVGAVPRVRSTGELVAQVRERRKADPAAIDSRMEQLGQLATEVSELGRHGSLEQFGDLANVAGGILAGLGLSVPAVESALGLLRDHGSLGGKISGGGGGGAFYGVFAAESTAREACGALESWLSKSHALPTGAFAATVRLA